MGVFAIYNGFIYNEFFSMPIDFFGSCYESSFGFFNPKNDEKIDSSRGYNRISEDCVYTIGVDPVWA